jgi:hypothetical protein
LRLDAIFLRRATRMVTKRIQRIPEIIRMVVGVNRRSVMSILS